MHPLDHGRDAAPPRRVVSILQSGFLPYLGFFELMARCDVFVIYDDVQFDKNSWRNRNRILSPISAPAWLSVPVLLAGRFGQTIREVEICNDGPWQKKHLGTLKQAYRKAPFFAQNIGDIESLYSRPWTKLVDLNQAFIDYFVEKFSLQTEIVFSSHLAAKGQKTDRIIQICKELGADAYISTNGAKAYLDEAALGDAQIRLAYQDYAHPEYSQLASPFISHLAFVDALFFLGEKVMDVAMSTSKCAFASPRTFRSWRPKR